MRAKHAKYHVEVEQPAPPIQHTQQPISQPPTMGFPPIPMVRPGMAPMAPPVGMVPPRMPPQGERIRTDKSGGGVGVAWVQIGHGVGLEWAWHGCGMDVAYVQIGRGVGVVWVQ